MLTEFLHQHAGLFLFAREAGGVSPARGLQGPADRFAAAAGGELGPLSGNGDAQVDGHGAGLVVAGLLEVKEDLLTH